MFEIYMMVYEIHVNVDYVLGINIFVELEAEISARALKFDFWLSIPMFYVHNELLKTKGNEVFESWRPINRY